MNLSADIMLTSKFKRCSTFNYCTAIQTNKDGQNMFSLESVNNHYHKIVQVANNSTKGNKYIVATGLIHRWYRSYRVR